MAWLSPGSLGVVALVLFVQFAVVVAGFILPLQLLDPAWQLRLVGGLIHGAPLALIGLALLWIASQLDPDDPVLQHRWQVSSRLAAVAAVAFLLLLPLQTMAGVHQYGRLNAASLSRLQAAERKLDALRRAVNVAAGSGELNRELQRLQGPVLGPADLVQPLPLLKAQVRAVLQQAEQQIARERQRTAPPSPWHYLPDLLRNAVACVFLAMGFAALGQRPGGEQSLLEDWRSWRPRLRPEPRVVRSPVPSDAEYLEQMMGEEDPR